MCHADGLSYRWLSIEADSEDSLDAAVREAALRGWSEVPLLRGTQPQTQRPAIILCKPANPVEPVAAPRAQEVAEVSALTP